MLFYTKLVTVINCYTRITQFSVKQHSGFLPYLLVTVWQHHKVQIIENTDENGLYTQWSMDSKFQDVYVGRELPLL